MAKPGYRLALLATVLAVVVVLLGAYTRLTHAGLGCPDWPGCYGFISVPASEADQIVKAVRAKGGTAWHLLGQNEGHGFAKKENADYQFWAGLLFWRQTLLGAK